MKIIKMVYTNHNVFVWFQLLSSRNEDEKREREHLEETLSKVKVLLSFLYLIFTYRQLVMASLLLYQLHYSRYIVKY